MASIPLIAFSTFTTPWWAAFSLTSSAMREDTRALLSTSFTLAIISSTLAEVFSTDVSTCCTFSLTCEAMSTISDTME